MCFVESLETFLNSDTSRQKKTKILLDFQNFFRVRCGSPSYTHKV